MNKIISNTVTILPAPNGVSAIYKFDDDEGEIKLAVLFFKFSHIVESGDPSNADVEITPITTDELREGFTEENIHHKYFLRYEYE